jgi:hypothetical protein
VRFAGIASTTRVADKRERAAERRSIVAKEKLRQGTMSGYDRRSV